MLDLTDLRARAKDELEDLFRRSVAGALPDGEAEGLILFPAFATRIIRLAAWRGKCFDRERGELENRILPFGVRAVRAQVYREPSWFDGAETIVLDYSKTSFVARKIRDEIREVAPGVYLGLVFWGRQKVGLFALKLSS